MTHAACVCEFLLMHAGWLYYTCSFMHAHEVVVSGIFWANRGQIGTLFLIRHKTVGRCGCPQTTQLSYAVREWRRIFLRHNRLHRYSFQLHTIPIVAASVLFLLFVSPCFLFIVLWHCRCFVISLQWFPFCAWFSYLTCLMASFHATCGHFIELRVSVWDRERGRQNIRCGVVKGLCALSEHWPALDQWCLSLVHCSMSISYCCDRRYFTAFFLVLFTVRALDEFVCFWFLSCALCAMWFVNGHYLASINRHVEKRAHRFCRSHSSTKIR